MVKFVQRSLIAVLLLTFAATEVKASFFENVQYGAAALGLNQQVKYDYLQDGWVYTVGQTYSDQKLDFGNAQLVLNGGIKGVFSFGRRGIPAVEAQITSPTGGLTYDYTYWDGPNKFQVQNGFFDINSDINLNKYGFYDIQLSITNRGTLTGDNMTPVPIDYDIGPINVHGQWVIDVINLTIGKYLGFTLPGGAADQIVTSLYDSINQPVEEALAGYYAQAQLDDPAAKTTITAVPEPATIGLLAFGLLGLLPRRR